MRLILQEYLSLLKESKELDALLPDLLSAMGCKVISRAQQGVRQDGIDVAAVGKDDDGTETLFLFVIKRGDVGRSDWGVGEQAVRPSLEEVLDVYLKSHLEPKYKKLRKKIVLCTGGVLKQDVSTNWAGYVESNRKPKKLEYDFWGGDQLSILIEKYMLNERLLPSEQQSKLRKVLSLISDPDYNQKDYHDLMQDILLIPDFGIVGKQSTKKHAHKALQTASLCQNIVVHWSMKANNILPAINCSERTVLNAWAVIRKYELKKNRKSGQAFLQIHETLLDCYVTYINDISAHCLLEDGTVGYRGHYIQECLAAFEILGILGTAAIAFLYQANLKKSESWAANAKDTIELLKQFISNNHATKAPCYDRHTNEISTALYLIAIQGDLEFAKDWVFEIVNSVAFSYLHLHTNFPIQSDSFEDLISLNISNDVGKETLFQMSTLLPILAQWSAVYGFEENYRLIHELQRDSLPDCTFQIWYPDDETDAHLYTSNAAVFSGSVEAPIFVPESLSDMLDRITQVQERTIKPNQLSSVGLGFTSLAFISSRHFETPILPQIWQQIELRRVKEQGTET